MITVFSSKMIVEGDTITWEGMRGEKCVFTCKDAEKHLLFDMTGFPKEAVKRKKESSIGIELWI